MVIRLVEAMRQHALARIAYDTRWLHEMECHVHCGTDCPDQGRWWCTDCRVDRTTQKHQDGCALLD